MKYASRSIGAGALCGLLLLLAAGCDVAPDYRLTETPVGAPSSGTLDPDSSANLTAYFYAAAKTDTDSFPAVPVEGLHFNCKQGGYIKVSGTTDADGKFVCPRTTTATFFIGDQTRYVMTLGKADLTIYGAATDTSARNRVTITPGTLYGTATDSNRKEVSNLFNLLASLDSQVSRAGKYQQTVVLTDVVQAGLSTLPEFQSLSLTANASQFTRDLRTVVNKLQTLPAVELRLATLRPALPVLDSLEVAEIADQTLVRARAGLYRNALTVMDTESHVDRIYSMTNNFRVESTGNVSGFLESLEVLTADASACGLDASNNPKGCVKLSLLNANPGGEVRADGKLVDVLFGPPSNTVSLVGSFVNDWLFGDSRLCQTSSPNSLVPSSYCTTPATSGGYELADSGEFDAMNLQYSGELNLVRHAETLPDIDLDLLEQDYLPRTFEMTLARYSDLGRSEFNDALTAGPEGDKDAFGALEELPQKFRYTLMPNGDIVSDVDMDCSDLHIVNGVYRDLAGDSREYVIGRIGNILRVNLAPTGATEINRSYLELHVAVLDQEVGSFFGLNIGYNALHRPLHPITIAEFDGKLASKKCDPRSTAECKAVMEWFNDVVYFNDIYKEQLQMLSDKVPATDPRYDALYKAPTYYGQITDNQEVHDSGSAICRPVPTP